MKDKNEKINICQVSLARDISIVKENYFNFIKRGVGRSTLQASDDVRRGLITREEAIELIHKYDPERPHALDYYLEITKSKEKDVEKITKELSAVSSKPTSFPGQRMKEIDALNALLNRATVQHMNYRDLTRLLAQYRRFGYANPVPIQKLKK